MSPPPFILHRNVRILKRRPLYNRKEKSLEELSRKFLLLFLEKDESLVSLDKITEHLGVERRRIYDIINILESLNLVSRRAKNNYKWNGFQRIYTTIREFEKDGGGELVGKKSQETHMKREKSLKILSVGFLNLFIHWKKVMPLEEAAKRLSNPNVEEHKIKTKIRRLYDIANVFKSLGLIKKTLLENKKPAFHWIGLKGLDEFSQTSNLSKQEESETKRNANVNNFLSMLLSSIEQREEEKTFSCFLLNRIKSIMTGDEKKEGKSQAKVEIIQSPKDLDDNHMFGSENEKNFITPIIKKTLTIIYPKDNDDSSTEKKFNFSNEGVGLKDSTNVLKRRHSIEISNKSSFKKIKRLTEEIREKENISPLYKNCQSV